MAEPSTSESSAGTDSDQDFDPSADMMVNDFDDEHTLDEEEALADDELTTKDEIDELTKEQDMPIEELLKMYGYSQMDGGTSGGDQAEASDSSNSMSTSQPQAGPSTSSTANQTGGQANSLYPSDIEDSESEEEEDNENEWRRTIQVGSDFQATIPDGLKQQDDNYAFEDLLLWKPPANLKSHQIDEYLFEYAKTSEEDNFSDFELPSGQHIKDDEQALYALMKANFKMKDSLRLHEQGQEPKAPIADPMSPWSEEECSAFENGLRGLNKDFFQIKHKCIPTRSVGEVISFYYLWKKTERHDLFANRYRIEKKKYTLHPGTTDYMDRFLDEQENMSLNAQNQGSTSNTSQLNSVSTHLNLNRQSGMSNSAQSSSLSRHHPPTETILLGPSVTLTPTRTFNVTATGEPQTIMINDSDFSTSNDHDKRIVVSLGQGGSSGGSGHSGRSHPSNHHFFGGQGSSSGSNTTTIVVGKNPVVLDGSWVSNSPASSSSSSAPSMSIYKVPPHHSTR